MDTYNGYSCRLGGTDISVLTRGCVLRNIGEDHYDTFYAYGKGTPDHCVSRIDVLVTTAECTIDPGMKPILDDHDWLHMFTDENGYTVAIDRTGSFENPILLKADHITKNVEIVVHTSMSSGMQGTLTVDDPFRRPRDQILLMNHLACQQGFIVHSAGAILDGRGFVFAGVSGAGKSTMTRQFMANSQGLKFLSDERMIIRKVNGEYRTYGTPWPGDAKIAENDSAPLKGIFFLTKAGENGIVPLKPSLALRRLFPVVSCPWYDKERLPQVLDTCEKVVTEIPCFEFRFTPDERAVQTLSDFIGNER